MEVNEIYMNTYRKSFKTHEKYVKYNKYNTYGYVKEVFGTQCLLDIVYYDNKIEVLANIADISVINDKNIPEDIMKILKIESEDEWMDNYFKNDNE
jgi:hypothetical protein